MTGIYKAKGRSAFRLFYYNRKRKGKAMDKYNNLTGEDLNILKKMGFRKADLERIDRSYAVTRYAIFKDGDDGRCIIITPEKARKLLGDTDFLSGLTRSIFHWSASRKIKGIDGYTLEFDSSELFSEKASRFTKLPSLKETYEDILGLKEESKKYEFTDETKTRTVKGKEHKLHRIRALKDFNNVKKGELGGFIEKEKNLSQEGDCWVGGNATVYEDARVFGNAWVYGKAEVYGKARVCGSAEVTGKAKVYGDTDVCDNVKIYASARVYGRASIYGRVHIYGKAEVFDDAVVRGEAKVYGDACVSNFAEVYGNAKVYGYASVYENAEVSEYAKVYGDASVYDNAEVSGNALVYEEAEVYGDAEVFGDAQVCDNAWVYGEALVCGDAKINGKAKISEGEISKGTIDGNEKKSIELD